MQAQRALSANWQLVLGAYDMNHEQKKANIRTGLVLLSVALVFLLGFVAKMVLLGK